MPKFPLLLAVALALGLPASALAQPLPNNPVLPGSGIPSGSSNLPTPPEPNPTPMTPPPLSSAPERPQAIQPNRQNLMDGPSTWTPGQRRLNVPGADSNPTLRNQTQPWRR